MTRSHALASGVALCLFASCVNSSSYSAFDLSASSVILDTPNVPADGATPARVVVNAHRADGTAVANVPVTLTDQLANVSTTATTDATGTANLAFVSGTPGQDRISVTFSPYGAVYTLPQQPPINFFQGANGNQVFTGTALNLQAIAPTAAHVSDPTYQGVAHFTSTDPSAVLPSDYTFVPADGGVHVFAGNLVFNTPGEQTATATDLLTGAVLGTVRLSVAPQPSTVTQSLNLDAAAHTVAGLPFSVRVQALNGTGLATSAYRGTVVLTSSDPQVSTLGSHTFTAADNGAYTFANLQLFTAGSVTVQASDGTLSTSTAVSVLAASPNSLAFIAQPADTNVCVTLPTVRVAEQDIYGNIANVIDTVITLSLAPNPWGATLQGALSVPTVNGVADFTNLSIRQVSRGLQLQATNGQLTANSNTFSIDNVPPQVTSIGPVQGTGGSIFVPYTVQDTCGTPVNVTVHYDSTGSGVYKRATEGPALPGSYGVHGAPTSVTGQALGFVWNSAADLAHVTNQSTSIQIAATARALTSASVTSQAFVVNNGVLLAPAQSLPATGAASCLAAADINRDGKADAIVCDASANQVHIFAGAGNGNFAALVTLNANAPVAVAVADVDANGALDLIVANGATAQAVIYKAAAPGTFANPNVLALPSIAVSVDVDDINHDGNPDLLFGSGGGMLVALGSRAGTYASVAAFATNQNLATCVFDDVNRDAVQDAACTRTDGTIDVFLGNKAGTVALANNVLLGGSGATQVAVVDVDRDGFPDIVATQAGTASFLHGVGNGNFALPRAAASISNVQSLALTDIDRDGRIDLLAGTATGNILSLRGAGDGNFTPSTTFVSGSVDTAFLVVEDLNRDSQPDLLAASATSANGVASFLNLHPLLVRPDWDGTHNYFLEIGGGIVSCTVADYNTDGRADVACTVNGNVASGDQAVQMALGDGAGHFVAGSVVSVGPLAAVLAGGDVNRDGIADVVVPNTAANNISVLLGDGNGSFLPEALFPVGDSPLQAILADVNGDSFLDVVTAEAYQITVALGMGNGTFGPGTYVPYANGPHAVAAGDINNDGWVDLVTADYAAGGQLWTFLNQGQGQFPTPVGTSLAGNFANSLDLGDVNHDGSLDVLVGYDPSAMQVLLNDGTGTFVANGTLMQAGPNTAGHLYARFTDLNQDGNLDIGAALPYAWGTVGLYGAGNGNFTAATRGGSDVAPTHMTTGDINEDGYPDLVLSNSGSADISVTLSNGQGGLRTLLPMPPNSIAPGSASPDVRAADFNHDGIWDLALRSAAGPTIAWGVGDGTFGASLTQVFAYGAGDANDRTLFVDDLNNDGWADVASVYGTALYVSLNNHGTFAAPVLSSLGASSKLMGGMLGDLNRDGLLDFVAADTNANVVRVALGAANGNFVTSASYSCTGAMDVALGDVDDNGSLDVLAAAANVTVCVGANDGNGNLIMSPLTLGSGTETGDRIALGDLNNDGLLDVVMSFVTLPYVLIALNNGTALAPANSYYITVATTGRVNLVDATQDGKLDLVWGMTNNNGVHVFPGHGDGTFDGAQDFFNTGYLHLDVFLSNSGVINATVVQDFDRDGRLDLAATNSGTGATSVLLGF